MATLRPGYWRTHTNTHHTYIYIPVFAKAGYLYSFSFLVLFFLGAKGEGHFLFWRWGMGKEVALATKLSGRGSFDNTVYIFYATFQISSAILYVRLST